MKTSLPGNRNALGRRTAWERPFWNSLARTRPVPESVVAGPLIDDGWAGETRRGREVVIRPLWMLRIYINIYHPKRWRQAEPTPPSFPGETSIASLIQRLV